MTLQIVSDVSIVDMLSMFVVKCLSILTEYLLATNESNCSRCHILCGKAATDQVKLPGMCCFVDENDFFHNQTHVGCFVILYATKSSKKS